MASILGKINYGLITYFNSYEYMNESVKGLSFQMTTIKG